MDNIKYYLFRVKTYDGNNVSVVGINPNELGTHLRLLYYLSMENILTEHMNTNIILISKLYFDTKEEAVDYFFRKYDTEGIESIQWSFPLI